MITMEKTLKNSNTICLAVLISPLTSADKLGVADVQDALAMRSLLAKITLEVLSDHQETD